VFLRGGKLIQHEAGGKDNEDDLNGIRMVQVFDCVDRSAQMQRLSQPSAPTHKTMSR
jgi:hypothetical protein